MVTRPDALAAISKATGESLISVTHCSRVMTNKDIALPYNTSIGRGNRHTHVSVDWLCSTFLAVVIASPKNAATQVPKIGNILVGPNKLFDVFKSCVIEYALHGNADKSKTERAIVIGTNDNVKDHLYVRLITTAMGNQRTDCILTVGDDKHSTGKITKQFVIESSSFKMLASLL